jgi:iron complex outermembrane receptor protein
MPGDPDPMVNKGDCFTLAENGSTDPFVGELNEDNFSYRVALDWKPVEEHLLYVSLGRGYKAGGFPVTNALRQSQYAPVTQEELQAYEVGGKLSFFDTQLHTNFAAYYYNYKDKQLLTKVPDEVFGPLPVLKNAPESRVYGVEFELQAAPQFIEGLFLTATGAYTNTRVLEFRSFDNSGEERDFAGRPFNFAPRLQYTLLANQSWALNDDLTVNVGGDYYHSSATNSTLEEDPRFRHNAYSLLGAHVGLRSAEPAWSLTFFGHNLLNEFYTLAVYQNGDAISRLAGRPRTYGVTLSYDWY